jgi:hypothetical protein
MRQATTAILASIGTTLVGWGSVRAGEPAPSKHIIVPGVGVGDFKLGMSKDHVLKKLGKPEAIHWRRKDYTLRDLPARYRMDYRRISFEIIDNVIQKIMVTGPSYTFANGLKVGDSEDKIKQAFGDNSDEDDHDFIYRDKKLRFSVDRKSETVIEIMVFQTAPHHDPLPGPLVFPKIDRRPPPDNDNQPEKKPFLQRLFSTGGLPKYDPERGERDLQGRDLSKLDLRHSIDDLLHASFDDRTVWPPADKMPSDFDQSKIMELGKNPGLGVRRLHKKGITGRGVRIAILDAPLFVDHQEYADRLQLYEEIHIDIGSSRSMHGSAVASIAVGKTVGVAPGAELFYIAPGFSFDWEEGGGPTLRYVVQGIHRLLEINEQLPEGKKIRAISISKGWRQSNKEFGLIAEAVQKARDAGILFVCVMTELHHKGCSLDGLGRSPLADPDDLKSYERGWFYVNFEEYWAGHVSASEGHIWAPMDSRTTASHEGMDEYVFCRKGSMSWAVPYVAGVYALAAQADPGITPERFWALAARTGRPLEVEHEGARRSVGSIIDPVRLIHSLEARKGE